MKNKNSFNKYEIDMTRGPVFRKLVQYSVPLILSGILQLLFNAVDIIVVGRYAGSISLAAVGSTTSLINMLTQFFIGISQGVSVCIAQDFSKGNDKDISDTVHTAIVSAVIFGFFTMFVGLFFGRRLLEMMRNPKEVIGLSTLYLRIYFCGMPFFMLYNFGAAILKAVGDTKRPLFYLTIAGVLNAILNVYLVVVWNLDVAGVAIATVVSQFISCLLTILCLVREKTSYHLSLNQLRFHKSSFMRILRIGTPAGLQTVLINLSNVLIQSSVNSFGAVAMAAYSTIFSIRSFCYIAVNSVTQAAMSFVGQNYGVRNFGRIKKITAECTAFSFILGSVLGLIVLLFGKRLAGIYTTEEEVVSLAVSIMPVIFLIFGVFGIMDVLPGAMRGMNHSVSPTVFHIFGSVVFRIFWIFLIFPMNRTLNNLFLSYPISWILTSSSETIAFCIIFRKELNRSRAQKV